MHGRHRFSYLKGTDTVMLSFHMPKVVLSVKPDVQRVYSQFISNCPRCRFITVFVAQAELWERLSRWVTAH